MDAKTEQNLLQELREQINTLLSASQLLSNLVQEKGSQRDAEYLSMINQTLYRLTRTIQHLDLCGDECLAFHPKAIDLADLCRRLGNSLELLSPDLGVKFWWELERESLFTMADKALIERALLNLLCNAIQAAGKGGSVRLSLGLNEDEIRLTVEDDGPGMTPKAHSDDPFLKQPGGLGLGNQVATRIARLHGGSLVWHDRDAGGLAAVLSLPLCPPPEDSQLVKAPEPDLGGGFSTLLVELSPLLPTSHFSHRNTE